MNALNATVGCVVFAFSLTVGAHAAPITYEISGIASGQIGTTAFTNAEVDLIGTADTNNITSFVAGDAADWGGLAGDTIFADPFSGFTVTIAGIGTAAINDQSELLAVPGASGAELIGRVDQPGVPGSTITGIGLIVTSALSLYTGTSAAGPITDDGGIGFPVGCSTPGNDPCISTSLGLLSFTSNINFPPTNQVTFTASLAPVSTPEPSTLFLLGGGIAALAWKRSQRIYH